MGKIGGSRFAFPLTVILACLGLALAALFAGLGQGTSPIRVVDAGVVQPDSDAEEILSRTSLLDLTESPARFIGRRIVVSGYLNTAEVHSNYVWLSRRDFALHNVGNAIAIELPHDDQILKEVREGYYRLEGTYGALGADVQPVGIIRVLRIERVSESDPF